MSVSNGRRRTGRSLIRARTFCGIDLNSELRASQSRAELADGEGGLDGLAEAALGIELPEGLHGGAEMDVLELLAVGDPGVGESLVDGIAHAGVGLQEMDDQVLGRVGDVLPVA